MPNSLSLYAWLYIQVQLAENYLNWICARARDGTKGRGLGCLDSLVHVKLRPTGSGYLDRRG